MVFEKKVWWGCGIFFVLVGIILYLTAPTIGAHFEGDSLRYQALASQAGLLGQLPLEVLGYPFFLWLFYSLFGVRVWIIVLAQILLSLACAWMIYRVAKRLVGPSAGAIVAIVWAGNLGFMIYSQLVLIEIILALALALFVERIVAYYDEPSGTRAVLAGAYLGLSVLLRPAALFFGPLCALGFLFCQRVAWRKRVVHALTFALAFYLPIVIYMIGVCAYFGIFALCPVMNVNLFVFFYPKLLRALHEGALSAPAQLATAIDYDIAHDTISRSTQGALVRLMLQFPWITIKIWLINMLKTLVGFYSVEWKLYFGGLKISTSFFALSGSLPARIYGYICGGMPHRWLCIPGFYEVWYLSMEYATAFIGFVWLGTQKKWWLVFFAAGYIAYFTAITGPDGSGRFRMMLEPWLLTLAVVGIWVLGKKFWRRL